MSIIKAAWTGVYEPHGNIEDASYAVGQAYGRRTVNGEIVLDPTNTQLAGFIVERSLEIPLFLQIEIAKGYTELTGEQPDLTIEDIIYTRWSNYLQCWEVGKQGLVAGQERGLGAENVLAIAHAKVVERFATQLWLLGARNVIVPPGLTNDHDPQSTQDWTTSTEAWRKREMPGLAVLALAGIGYAHLMIRKTPGTPRPNTIE